MRVVTVSQFADETVTADGVQARVLRLGVRPAWAAIESVVYPPRRCAADPR